MSRVPAKNQMKGHENMVMELFTQQHFIAESKEEYFPLKAKGKIYIGDAPEKEDDRKTEFGYNEARIRQYPTPEGVMINELSLIEAVSEDELNAYGNVLRYDILHKRCGAQVLSSVLISADDNYAYIYSGSRRAKIYCYKFDAGTIRITRLAFDGEFISKNDLEDVIEKVFCSDKCNMLLRSESFEQIT